ncbi:MULTISPECIES: hypothetical protein [Pandoraea]|uniref:Uncharacterized protein n=2 Tax=Pandoraea TaxID=93217 RepID=A0A5E4XED2_9BURK|nr:MULTISPECIES: hypothetical protein [Pandoraea]VVE16858.1 hypothetical protein PCE31107_02940 [Pandoraea cepalis]VVE34667.1 hypothetical protein PTE31013_03861 [Pandoraea terrigena]
MTMIIAAAVAFIFIAAVRAGAGSNEIEEASDALDRCPQCGNYLPCNCNHYEDSSYQHHHHHDQWPNDAMNQSSQDDSCLGYGHHHHGGSDDWN